MSPRSRWSSGWLGALAVVAGCSAAAGDEILTVGPANQPAGARDGGAGRSDGGAGDGKDDPAAPGGPGAPGMSGPFAPQPDESEGLTNLSPSLDALLEHGALAGACDRYRAGATDRRTKLLCGKWMYFYATFDTAGIPLAIVQFFAQNFEAELGLAYGELGLVPDPHSNQHLPLGLAKTVPLKSNIDAVAFTCASCHFAKLPDGRYAVGAPNHDYDYAGHILTISLAASIGLGMTKASDHHPAAVAKIQPVLDRLGESFALRAKLGVALAPLASLDQPALGKTVEGQYASWPTGALDFVIAPLPVDDHAHVVGKILPLWGIPREAERSAAGMSTALLAWSGSAQSLEEFIEGFAILGGAKKPSASEMEPLIEYIYSLRAPAPPSAPPAAQVSAGEALFTAKGCAKCHDGPRGSGKRAFTFAEIGTDDALAGWLDPSGSGNACCGVPVKPGGLTHGVKAPRLAGMWTLKRFLHNGSLSSLEELFCLTQRPDGATPLRTTGHTFTCDGLSPDEKKSLIAYLEAH